MTQFDLIGKRFLTVLEERVYSPEMVAITVVIAVAGLTVIVTVPAAHAAEIKKKKKKVPDMPHFQSIVPPKMWINKNFKD